MAPIYPAFSANKSDHLKVSDLHSIYYEDCGNPDGVPILYLHGGPGGGIEDSDRFFASPILKH
jgi:proline iminopeptidase